MPRVRPFKRRSATHPPMPLPRGLKPTATLTRSLRDQNGSTPPHRPSARRKRRRASGGIRNGFQRQRRGIFVARPARRISKLRQERHPAAIPLLTELWGNLTTRATKMSRLQRCGIIQRPVNRYTGFLCALCVSAFQLYRRGAEDAERILRDWPAIREPQRDSVLQAKVARDELPWESLAEGASVEEWVGTRLTSSADVPAGRRRILLRAALRNRRRRCL